MRCKNCGWDNPGKNVKCEKCNAPLTGDFRGASETVVERFDPAKTAIGCPECGYPMRAGNQSCPNCGRSFGDEKINLAKEPNRETPKKPAEDQKLATGQTVNPWAKIEPENEPEPTCSLTLIAKDDETLDVLPILQYTGSLIELNRSNTEPANQTITSKVQAELCFEDGKWYISNKSAMKTTFIQVGEKKEISRGDVIVLGNRLFEFND